MNIINVIKNSVGPFILVGAVYAAIYFSNNYFTEFLYLMPGAHLVHIPSGFKLLFTVLARWSAALAIACVSFLNGYLFMFAGDTLLNLQLACASGLAPLLTWLFFRYRFQLDDNLGNITFRIIVLMGIFFALLNSSLIQLILFWAAVHSDFVQGFAVNAIGDITGLYIVMAIVKLSASLLHTKKSE